jgi:hypothetical protein
LPDLTKPLRKQEYRLEKMDNELLLFNPQDLVVLYLNESASVVWQLCDGQRTISQIAELIAEAYPEAEKSILDDVQETILLFRDKGAVTLI